MRVQHVKVEGSQMGQTRYNLRERGEKPEKVLNMKRERRAEDKKRSYSFEANMENEEPHSVWHSYCAAEQQLTSTPQPTSGAPLL